MCIRASLQLVPPHERDILFAVAPGGGGIGRHNSLIRLFAEARHVDADTGLSGAPTRHAEPRADTRGDALRCTAVDVVDVGLVDIPAVSYTHLAVARHIPGCKGDVVRAILQVRRHLRRPVAILTTGCLLYTSRCV